MFQLLIACLTLLLTSCATVQEAGYSYFKLSKAMAGVETYHEALDRMEHHQEMRSLVYRNFSQEQMLQCTILRNQFYVAALKKVSGQEGEDMEKLASLLEEAYQQGDDPFMRTCEQVKNSIIGKKFARIAYRYLPWDKKEYKNVPNQ